MAGAYSAPPAGAPPHTDDIGGHTARVFVTGFPNGYLADDVAALLSGYEVVVDEIRMLRPHDVRISASASIALPAGCVSVVDAVLSGMCIDGYSDTLRVTVAYGRALHADPAQYMGMFPFEPRKEDSLLCGSREATVMRIRICEDPMQKINLTFLEGCIVDIAGVAKKSQLLRLKLEPPAPGATESTAQAEFDCDATLVQCMRKLNDMYILPDEMKLSCGVALGVDTIAVDVNDRVQRDYRSDDTGRVITLTGWSSDAADEAGNPMFSASTFICLAGLYGNVLQVKVNRQSTLSPVASCLVEYEKPESVSFAIKHMAGLPVYGHRLIVKKSDYLYLQLLGDDASQQKCSPDDHRYPPSANLEEVAGPATSSVLIANLPPRVNSINEKRSDVQTFKKDVKRVLQSYATLKLQRAKDGAITAVATFKSVASAVMSLLMSHGHRLQNDDPPLCVSFFYDLGTRPKRPLALMDERRKAILGDDDDEQLERPATGPDAPNRGSILGDVDAAMDEAMDGGPNDRHSDEHEGRDGYGPESRPGGGDHYEDSRPYHAPGDAPVYPPLPSKPPLPSEPPLPSKRPPPRDDHWQPKRKRAKTHHRKW
eukprot:TRINITY_DN5165_c0_g1_i1.p1 TRINITY_DN5165_c0_g1~~TRINITY_DN5165_c0_g1_i1.p1  ORF type:complete len:597 (+),score=78.60 TRINITY_DN5165_c0_g1_i1:29-1819(+)